jgi:hypothetical protein
MLKLFREEYCKNCVKLVRAIWAIGLDAIIVLVVVQVAIGTSYVVDHELKGASYESSVNWAHSFADSAHDPGMRNSWNF